MQTDFIWPTTREEGLDLLDFFTNECLENFGDFQDAMTPEVLVALPLQIIICTQRQTDQSEGGNR
jgi:deoxyribodipyrimidine photolyase-like uncharacterized protein